MEEIRDQWLLRRECSFLSERIPVCEWRFDDGLGKSSKDNEGSSEGDVLDARVDGLTNNI